MVLISHKYKFIYLKNYKVASTSVESFFGQYCINPSLNYSFEDNQSVIISEYGIIGSRIISDKIWYNHNPACDIKRDLGEDIFNTYFKFCVIRNPYDYMVSSYYWDYRNNYRPIKSFKQYVIDYTISDIRNNLNRLFIDDKEVCNAYIRYESLEEDIKKIICTLEITDYNISKLPNHKSGYRPKGTHYREYYDEETRNLVYNLFKTEIDMFGYEF